MRDGFILVNEIQFIVSLMMRLRRLVCVCRWTVLVPHHFHNLAPPQNRKEFLRFRVEVLLMRMALGSLSSCGCTADAHGDGLTFLLWQHC